MMSTETFSSAISLAKACRSKVAGQLNYRSIERLEQYPMQEKSNQSVQHLQVDAVSVPLEHISIWRGFAIFRLDDREKRRAESFALEPDEFHQVVLGILVRRVVGPLFSPLRNHPEEPTGRCLRAYVVELLEAIGALELWISPPRAPVIVPIRIISPPNKAAGKCLHKARTRALLEREGNPVAGSPRNRATTFRHPTTKRSSDIPFPIELLALVR